MAPERLPVHALGARGRAVRAQVISHLDRMMRGLVDVEPRHPSRRLTRTQLVGGAAASVLAAGGSTSWSTSSRLRRRVK